MKQRPLNEHVQSQLIMAKNIFLGAEGSGLQPCERIQKKIDQVQAHAQMYKQCTTCTFVHFHPCPRVMIGATVGEYVRVGVGSKFCKKPKYQELRTESRFVQRA